MEATETTSLSKLLTVSKTKTVLLQPTCQWLSVMLILLLLTRKSCHTQCSDLRELSQAWTWAKTRSPITLLIWVASWWVRTIVQIVLQLKFAPLLLTKSNNRCHNNPYKGMTQLISWCMWITTRRLSRSWSMEIIAMLEQTVLVITWALSNRLHQLGLLPTMPPLCQLLTPLASNTITLLMFFKSHHQLMAQSKLWTQPYSQSWTIWDFHSSKPQLLLHLEVIKTLSQLPDQPAKQKFFRMWIPFQDYLQEAVTRIDHL